jgi:Type I phosphodiesterase / nucleotide pyrophosphatase
MALRWDDIVLSVQQGIDRLIRRLRRGAASEVTQRRFLIIQIDGLSRAVLDKALAGGRMPFVRRLLRRHGHRVQPMSVGLPTSTPAFQMAAMYGVRPPDIPGFHYYSRERQGDIHFPRKGHAAWVEEKLAGGRRGILQGGSAYGCVFTGGADNSFFTFATLTQPSGHGVLAALSPFIVLAWVCAASSVRTLIELVKIGPHLANPVKRQQSRRWFMIKVGISVWIRGFFTMATCRDLYAGVPAVYVNYVDYDEAAHAFGPSSRPALVTLARVDRAIRQLWRVVRRVPEHQYDFYILADHGQTPCKPYREVNGGQRFEQWIFEQGLTGSPEPPKRDNTGDQGLAHGIRSRRKGVSGFFQHFLNYVDEDYMRRSDPEAYEKDGIRVISAGPNAFLYCLDEKEPCDFDRLEKRFPGLAQKLSQSPGVGLVLARSSSGPVCFCQGKRYRFPESGAGPFAGRADAALVIQGITDLMTMPSAGDFVIYGTGAAGGHVSFIPEHGSHAGPSSEEMNTFIVRPPKITLAQAMTHPSQLYDHFIRYQAGFTNDARYSSEQSQHHRSDHRAARMKENQKGLQTALRLGSNCTRPGKLTLAGDDIFW